MIYYELSPSQLEELKFSMKDSGVDWIGQIPENWQIDHIKQHFTIKKRIAGREGYPALSITQQGIKEKDIASNEGQMAQSYANYQFGVTSPDYRVFVLSDTEHCYAPFYLRVFQIGYKRRIFYKFGKGAANQGRWRFPKTAFIDFPIQVPPIEEKKIIFDVVTGQVDVRDEVIPVYEIDSDADEMDDDVDEELSGEYIDEE